ncbi:MAG: type II toxin-antitoxin system VapC family toxin [Waterburya sp.]
MIVADANLIAYLLIDGDFTSQAEKVYLQDSDWVAPFLWRSEFANILSLYMRRSIFSLSEAQEIMRSSLLLLNNLEAEVAINSVLELANASGLSSYDCEYLVLAKKLDIFLVTSDRKIIKAFPEIAISPFDF